MSTAYKWYVVAILMLCQLLASIDARLPYILVEALKEDLALSDMQIGLITGPAFSLTYAICAIPIARLSDRRSRIGIIGVAITVWSGFTAFAGFAGSFASFALTRVGVAIGESALTPAAHSLIAHYIPRRSHAKGIAVYSFGVAAGALVAFAAGGYIGDRFGWRMAFVVIGGLGLFLSILLIATVREPARVLTARARTSVRRGVLGLLRCPVIRHVTVGGALVGFSSGAINAWAPAYIMRTFNLSATDAGLSYGIIAGLLAMIGTLAGGFVGSWLSKRHSGYALHMLSGVLGLAMAAQVISLLVSSYFLFLSLLAIAVLLSCFYIGPTFATVHARVGPETYSFASAVTLFCVNGLGISMGAFVVGLLSDVLQSRGVVESLKWALVMVSAVKAWSALHYWRAGEEMFRLGKGSQQDSSR
ncbi:MFS transporter [Marinobacter nanhaiticus]|uniref:MFS transporter n=1 Tax=Marinobacter nanhaiticus TaxID=1305740 RepID=UPI00146166BA